MGAGGRASDVTLDQLSVQQLFEQHDDAHDDADEQVHLNLMRSSSAQIVHEDKGTAHDYDSAQVPTLPDVPTGRQLSACIAAD